MRLPKLSTSFLKKELGIRTHPDMVESVEWNEPRQSSKNQNTQKKVPVMNTKSINARIAFLTLAAAAIAVSVEHFTETVKEKEAGHKVSKRDTDALVTLLNKTEGTANLVFVTAETSSVHAKEGKTVTFRFAGFPSTVEVKEKDGNFSAAHVLASVTELKATLDAEKARLESIVANADAVEAEVNAAVESIRDTLARTGNAIGTRLGTGDGMPEEVKAIVREKLAALVA